MCLIPIKLKKKNYDRQYLLEESTGNRTKNLDKILDFLQVHTYIFLTHIHTVTIRKFWFIYRFITL